MGDPNVPRRWASPMPSIHSPRARTATDARRAKRQQASRLLVIYDFRPLDTGESRMLSWPRPGVQVTACNRAGRIHCHMDSPMMYMTLQTTRLREGAVGAATTGRGGFSMRSNGVLGIGMIGATTCICGGFALLSRRVQGMGASTHAPLFADVDGIGVPRRRKRRS